MKKNEKLSYESAYQELQTITTALQSNEIGIDALAEKVKRASELVAFCQQKLRATEEEIEKITKGSH